MDAFKKFGFLQSKMKPIMKKIQIWKYENRKAKLKN